jgi:hypothetical protein
MQFYRMPGVSRTGARARRRPAAYAVGVTIEPGTYRHFKGGEYEVIGVAHHSETDEEHVVYRALYGEGGLWVRPLELWTQDVERDGYAGPRFIRVT